MKRVTKKEACHNRALCVASLILHGICAERTQILSYPLFFVYYLSITSVIAILQNFSYKTTLTKLHLVEFLKNFFQQNPFYALFSLQRPKITSKPSFSITHLVIYLSFIPQKKILYRILFSLTKMYFFQQTLLF